MNKRKPLWQSFLMYILAFSLYIFLFTSNLRLLATRTWVVMEQKRAGVAEETQFSDKELKEIDAKVLRFMNSGELFSSITVMQNGKEVKVFKAREVSHLYDVQGIFRVFSWARSISIFLLLVLIFLLVADNRDRKRLIYGFLSRAGLFFLATVGGLFLFVLLAFNLFFTEFHQLVFAPGTWIFGSGEILPQLFPERFWLESALALTAACIAETVLVIFIFRELRFSLEGKKRF